MAKSLYEERLVAGLKKAAGLQGESLVDPTAVYRLFEKLYQVPTGKSQCLCGKKGLRFRYKIVHRQSGKTAIVGSKCQRHFKTRCPAKYKPKVTGFKKKKH